MQIIPVILSGGSGSRLWPLSRAAYPKQLLPLTGPDTLIQQTARRASSLRNSTSPLIVCNNEHRFLVAEQLHEAGFQPLDIMLEPVGRNTAPAIGAAAFRCTEEGPENIMLVLPADHLLGDLDKFQVAVESAAGAASEGKLVTFGITPSSAETGYGYIRRGKSIRDNLYAIESFVEKPDKQHAEEYLSSGDYFWNSGMFLFRPDTYLAELKRWQPDMHEKCLHAYEKASRDLDFLRLETGAFQACPSDSIDYAVMEKTENGVVVGLDGSWSDIGSWDSLWDVSPKDVNGNVLQGDVMVEDVADSMLFARKRLLAALGIRNLVIIETPDAVLVADKNRSQDIKKIVSRLKENQREEFLFHSKVYRPWGSYEGLVSGERFQVKLITVKPGAKLSVQMHHHRAEHWIIVKGTARIRKGDESILLTENQSTFIPLGTVHSLENPGKIPLELIEVQSGSYLGEDDIVRLEDVYGRV
ncbi:MAG: mannose-1-phosphate guanylyltransferase/mannose-6-phosphate isomerase [Thermodesulfatator sp.]|nr:MAG: mannose-1-phosphate guanylyltransferase/mannose-6-phosphate isomerase [Thermodesulfatator sp.]